MCCFNPLVQIQTNPLTCCVASWCARILYLKWPGCLTFSFYLTVLKSAIFLSLSANKGLQVSDLQVKHRAKCKSAVLQVAELNVTGWRSVYKIQKISLDNESQQAVDSQLFCFLNVDGKNMNNSSVTCWQLCGFYLHCGQTFDFMLSALVLCLQLSLCPALFLHYLLCLSPLPLSRIYHTVSDLSVKCSKTHMPSLNRLTVSFRLPFGPLVFLSLISLSCPGALLISAFTFTWELVALGLMSLFAGEKRFSGFNWNWPQLKWIPWFAELGCVWSFSPSTCHLLGA